MLGLEVVGPVATGGPWSAASSGKAQTNANICHAELHEAQLKMAFFRSIPSGLESSVLRTGLCGTRLSESIWPIRDKEDLLIIPDIVGKGRVRVQPISQ